MAAVADYTEFWLACATAGPVLLIPTDLMVRQQRAPGSTLRAGVSVASVAFLAAGTILALIQLSGGGPVGGKTFGRVIELVLLCVPVATLAVNLMRDPGNRTAPRSDAAGLPEIADS
jgi:hypothetical protein